MKKVEIPRILSIALLRDMYLNKEATPADVIADIIQRVNDDAEMNIWITPPDMDTLRPYLERIDGFDPAAFPLWGIPFAIKDNIDLAGVPTTAGCPEYAYMPGEHAAVVERLIAAGAIPLGKTNLDQFATGLVGTRSPYGETHNALRQELISGGSSSGSAVAVARGHAAFALGTDTAGSGRVPAALNGLIGYKSSLGAWPTKGVVPACASLDCVTVFTRSLQDALMVDAEVRGVENSDPWSKSIPRYVPRQPGKVYVPKEDPQFYGAHTDEYRQAWDASVERLAKAGLTIEFVDTRVFTEAAEILYGGPFVAERWADLGSFIESKPGKTFPVTEQVLRSGGDEKHTAAAVFNSIHQLQTFKLEARKLLKDAVLVMPTCGGTWSREQVREEPIATNSAMGRYTNHCNLLDLCAIAVPSGDAAPNTPFGITFFALAENEDLIFGAADTFMARAELRPINGKQTTLVAVCGLHKRGFPLEHQMLACGARFVREAMTASKYQMVKLPTVPAKPGLIKKSSGGGAVTLEIWEMPVLSFGAFAASIPAPLGIGKVELDDGSEIPGFVCESYAAAEAEDITSEGVWK
jgi:allophanate hydrolase